MRPSFDAPLPPIEPFGVAPFPAAGEHFGSYVRRLAFDNGFESIGTLTSHLGLTTMRPRSSERVWSRLAEATGFNPSVLAPMQLHYRGEKRDQLALIDGAEIQYGFLDRVHLRSCPLCLGEDGYLPTRFAIRQITACARHGVKLTDECSCGRPRHSFDRRSIWDCPECGLPASQIPAETADPRELRIARLLSVDPTLTPVELPPALLAEPLTGRAAVIERLGRLHVLERKDGPSMSRHNVGAKTPDGTDNARRLLDDREVVLAAGDLLEDWPTIYHALLARLVDRHHNAEASNALLKRFSSEAGHVALRSFVDHDRRIIPFGEDARKTFLSNHLGHGRLGGVVLRKSGHYASMPCTPGEVVDEPRSGRDFVPAFEFGNRLHVGDRFNIEPWFEAGLIGTVQHADGSVLVKRADFDALLALVETLPDAPGDAAEFVSAGRCNNQRGAFYHQRYLIEDVLAGRIRSRAAGDGSEGMKSRLVNLADFTRRRMLAKTAIQIIIDEFVGVPAFVPALWDGWAPDKAELERHRLAGTLRFIPAKPRNRLSVRDVVRLVQEETGSALFMVDPAHLGGLSAGDWPSIVLDDSLRAK